MCTGGTCPASPSPGTSGVVPTTSAMPITGSSPAPGTCVSSSQTVYTTVGVCPTSQSPQPVTVQPQASQAATACLPTQLGTAPNCVLNVSGSYTAQVQLTTPAGATCSTTVTVAQQTNQVSVSFAPCTPATGTALPQETDTGQISSANTVTLSSAGKWSPASFTASATTPITLKGTTPSGSLTATWTAVNGYPNTGGY